MRSVALHNIKKLKYCDAFYMNIPHVSSKGKPYYISEDFLESFPTSCKNKVIINRCKDVGPITKLLPTLYSETNPRTIIVTLDDDVLLKKDISQIILDKHYQHPNSCLSFSGFLTGFPPFCWQFAIHNRKDIEADWLQGCHSQAFVRGLINADALCKFKPYIFKHDDHRIAGFLSQEGVTKLSIDKNPCDYFTCDPDLSKSEPISGSFDFFIQNAKICYAFRKEGLYKQNDRTLWVYSITGLIFFTILLFAITLFTNKLFPGRDLYFMALFSIILFVLLYSVVATSMM